MVSSADKYIKAWALFCAMHEKEMSSFWWGGEVRVARGWGENSAHARERERESCEELRGSSTIIKEGIRSSFKSPVVIIQESGPKLD